MALVSFRFWSTLRPSNIITTTTGIDTSPGENW